MRNLLENYTDEELFRRFKCGDMDAFEQIYSRYSLYLTRETAKRLRSYFQASDIVQDIFITLIRKSQHIEINVSLKAYLFRMMHYKVSNLKRDMQIHNRCHNEIIELNKNASIGFDSLEQKEIFTKLHSIILSLPERCKQAFILSREKNYSYKDISRELNISVSTVEKHIIKALKIIKYELSYYNETIRA